MFTIRGAKYRDKGIVRFIKNKRRNDLFNSPVLKFWILLIPIIISLIFNAINYKKTDRIESRNPTNEKCNNIPELLFEQPTKETPYKRETKPNVDTSNIVIEIVK